MNDSNNLNIVILNWNGWHDTQKCIESVIEYTKDIQYTICLVDNGSKYEEIKIIEEYLNQNFSFILSGDRNKFLSNELSISTDFINKESKDKVIFIKNNENLGFAKGNNSALNILKQNNQTKVILLNNDTELYNNAFKLMFNYLQNDNVGAIIPQIRYYKPNNLIWNCGGKIDSFGIRKYYHAFDDFSVLNNKTKIQKVDFGTGCALMFDINKVGVLSEKYFFGEEDYEFAFRLKKINKDIICIYDAILYHKVGASRSKISENEVGKMVYHYCQRISNLKDNLPKINWIISVVLHFGSSILQLKRMNSLKISTVYNCWKTILKSLNKEVFTLNDFKTISNDRY